MDSDNKDYVTDVTVKGLQCQRCSWKWLPRGMDVPLTCPHCPQL